MKRLIILTFFISFQVSSFDKESKGLEEFRKEIDKKLNLFELNQKTHSYLNGTTISTTEMTELSPEDVPSSWQICTPNESGQQVSCKLLPNEHIALAIHTTVCNSSGTGYNLSECDIIDCLSGYTGDSCEIKE